MRTRYFVHPACNQISKFFPHNPPAKHDRVHVEDIGLCRVVRDPKLDWDGRAWTLRSPILVEPLPA